MEWAEQAYLGFHRQSSSLHLSSLKNLKPLETGQMGEGYLPKDNSCDEVKKAERVHNVPQVSEVIHPIHVPLRHRKGERAREQLGNVTCFLAFHVHTFFFWILLEPMMGRGSPNTCRILFQGYWKVSCTLAVLLLMCCWQSQQKNETHAFSLCLKDEPTENGYNLWGQMWNSQATTYSGVGCALHNSTGCYPYVIIIDLCIYCKIFLICNNKTSW